MPDPKSGKWFEEFRNANGEVRPAVPPPQRGEWRRHPRFLVFDVEACVTHGGTPGLLGLTRRMTRGSVVDLSEGGARISIKSEIRGDTPLQILLELPKFKDRITCDGLVRWCLGDAANPGTFHVGIKFMDLDPSAAKRIGHMREWFTSEHCSQFRVLGLPARAKLEKETPALPVVDLGTGIWLIAPKGVVDGARLGEFMEQLKQTREKRAQSLLLDLREVEFASTGDVEEFLRIVDEAAEKGIKVVFVATPPALKAVFALVKPGRTRNFVPDLALAKALVTPARPPGAR